MFFHRQCFSHRAYVENYRSALLNAEETLKTSEEFLSRTVQSEVAHFIKPNDDLKSFTGGVYSYDAMIQIASEAIRRDSQEAAGEIVISRLREIDAEYCCFVVEGRVVAGGMYRPSDNPTLPREIVRFVEAAAEKWAPAPGVVMAVARVERNWKIVECNCFNGSRFYRADLRALVTAVSQYQERRFALDVA